eukprot:TRINITY_DN71121_c0_g1_i1.p1 TRINITY_DN71121_c0_g1~~TRINITY_DN71121_c0_g1_i1.p1  ORF type:complete len:250 (-),score=27.72 TRINITY_DN71121_c0_g1_i1:254-1003(-)
MVRANVQQFGGAVLCLDAEDDATISSLKALIAKELDVPPSYQNLVYDASVMGDDVSLLEVSGLRLTLVVSASRVLSAIESGDRNQKCAALRDIGHIGHQAGVDAVLAAIGRLQDPENEVKITALQVLPHLVERGDEEVVRAVMRCFQSRGASVKIAALQALQKVSRPSDRRPIAIAVAYLQHPNHAIRIAAREVLDLMTPDAGSSVHSAVKTFLAHHESDVRRAGVERGDKQATAVLVRRIFGVVADAE